MSLIVTAGEGSNFELCPAGVYVGVCVWVIDMGMQFSPIYQRTSRKVKLGFEFPNDLMQDGRPFLICKNFTMSLNEKASLRKDLASWRGRDFTPEELKGFDVKSILGAPCQINIIHNQSDDGTRTYANIGAIMPLVKGMEKPTSVGDLIFYNSEEPNPAMWEKIPDGIKEKISSGGVPANVAPQAQPSPYQNVPNSAEYSQHQQQKQNGYQPQQDVPPNGGFDDEIPF